MKTKEPKNSSHLSGHFNTNLPSGKPPVYQLSAKTPDQSSEKESGEKSNQEGEVTNPYTQFHGLIDQAIDWFLDQQGILEPFQRGTTKAIIKNHLSKNPLTPTLDWLGGLLTSGQTVFSSGVDLTERIKAALVFFSPGSSIVDQIKQAIVEKDEEKLKEAQMELILMGVESVLTAGPNGIRLKGGGPKISIETPKSQLAYAMEGGG